MLSLPVSAPDRIPSPPAAGPGGELAFDTVYDAWFEPVVRWLRAMGCPDSELEDLAQEVFIVVRRRLAAFDGRNLPGWLYTIAHRQARDLRRRAWFRNLFSRRADDPEELGGHGDDALKAVEDRERQRLLERILARMSDKRRAVFVLFEIEGYSGEEIAALMDIPIGTVWTRLHHARRDFLARVRALTGAAGRGD